ncbi:unknown [Acidaminococcus intestini CAG:325]|nr:unknown [Acidaminococcus intestini CAG:325]
MDAVCQVFDACGARNSQSNETNEGHKDTCRNKAPVCKPKMAPGKLSQMDRENQVPCTKHHAKEHGSQKEILSTGQLFHEVLLMDRN